MRYYYTYLYNRYKPFTRHVSPCTASPSLHPSLPPPFHRGTLEATSHAAIDAAGLAPGGVHALEAIRLEPRELLGALPGVTAGDRPVTVR